MRTENLKLPNGKYNRTYNSFTITMPNEISYDLRYTDVIMQVKRSPESQIIKEFSTNLGITKIPLDVDVPDSPIYTIKINQFVCDIRPGEYVYDILFLYQNREVSYISGSWIIEETVTVKP